MLSLSQTPFHVSPADGPSRPSSPPHRVRALQLPVQRSDLALMLVLDALELLRLLPQLLLLPLGLVL